MVRVNRVAMQSVAQGINKCLSEILVCPLTKQPLRYCEKTDSLISDQIGVSFPIVDGIPHLVPKDGKILEDDESSTSNPSVKSSAAKDV
ncbi:hypothetical protein RND81_13G215700 [Saponaria officinalis]|uniref:Protein preY, mitochondrial n=1 Tax=Saponaria officinalis TaxID=3572 RepID=A0AAW1H446_SAPOF